jgi:F420-dependent oxidoreductase-like protein
VVAVGVMIEAQEDMTWDRWHHLARRVEDLGFESMWRSDHFHSLAGAFEREALETWTSLSVLATETSRISFGPLVCSVTFRHPSLLARMAAAVDRLSGGRLICGVGAGWNEGEHTAFGMEFPPTGTRMRMLDEYAQVLRLLWSGEPVSFEGRHYRLKDARCLPTPANQRMPILIGGSGDRLLSIAARRADEWNFHGHSLDLYASKLATLRERCKEDGRDADEITLSWMSGFIIGTDDADLEEHAHGLQRALPPLAAMEVKPMLEMLGSNGWLVGTPDRVAEAIREREKAGIQRQMLQHHDHGNDRAIEILAREVLPDLA